MEKPMSSSVKVSSFITYGSWRQRRQDRHHFTRSYWHTIARPSCKPAPPRTLILLSFIWIFLETTLAQYFSPKKSQNILPRKALTQASGSAVSSELWPI